MGVPAGNTVTAGHAKTYVVSRYDAKREGDQGKLIQYFPV